MIAKECEILLVEDNPGDVVLLREALDQLGLSVRLYVARDGSEAMDFLRHPSTSHLNAVVLDLNLPVMNGREVLAEMSADPQLRQVPVAILTTSTDEADAALQFTKERCAFFVKTADMQQFLQTVSDIHAFAKSA